MAPPPETEPVKAETVQAALTHLDPGFDWGDIPPFLEIDILRTEPSLLKTQTVDFDSCSLRKGFDCGEEEESMQLLTNFTLHDDAASILKVDKMIRQKGLKDKVETCVIHVGRDGFDFQVPTVFLEMMEIRNAQLNECFHSLKTAVLKSGNETWRANMEKLRREEEIAEMTSKQVERGKKSAAKIQVLTQQVKDFQKSEESLNNLVWEKEAVIAIHKDSIEKLVEAKLDCGKHFVKLNIINKWRCVTAQNQVAKIQQIANELRPRVNSSRVVATILRLTNQKSLQAAFLQWRHISNFKTLEASISFESCVRATLNNFTENQYFHVQCTNYQIFITLDPPAKELAVKTYEGICTSWLFTIVTEVGQRYYPAVDSVAAHTLIVEFCKKSSGFDVCEAKNDYQDWTVIRDYFIKLATFTMREQYSDALVNADLSQGFPLHITKFKPFFQRVILEEQTRLQQRLDDLKKLQASFANNHKS